MVRMAARQLLRDQRQQDYYDATLGGAQPFSHKPPTPCISSRGRYKLSAPGGADVGPFSVTVDVTPTLLWKNRARTETIERDAGVTLEWKAARASDAMLILAENANRSTGDSAACLCLAAARDGGFQIPPVALGNVPGNLTN
jgi:hypothetical protein